MDNNSFRTIQSVGRFALIEELMEGATVTLDEVVQGPGDDAAVLRPASGYLQLSSSETFMEGVDFDLTYTPLNHLGYKIAASAVSDIYAMNGIPQTITVNLALPNKLSVEMVKEIYRGIFACGHEHNFQVVGGDLTASHQILAMSIHCQGIVSEEDLTLRSTAKEDDAICVTGDLGGAIAGLRILMREKKYWQEQGGGQQFQPDLGDYEYVVSRQLVPAVRKDITGIFKAESIKPTAMIDISQGLVNELTQLADSSALGAYIYQAALPIAIETRQVADEMKEDVDKYALYGGEDFELLFTLPEKTVEPLMKECKDFTVIGKMVPASEGLVMQQAEGGTVEFGRDEK